MIECLMLVLRSILSLKISAAQVRFKFFRLFKFLWIFFSVARHEKVGNMLSVSLLKRLFSLFVLVRPTELPVTTPIPTGKPILNR